mgnify:CR=1 FL=1
MFQKKIGKIFQKHNIHLGYKINNNHTKILQNTEHSTDKRDCSGIYEINCECGFIYVRKTTRKFKQRFKEHRNSFIYNKQEKFTYANHLIENPSSLQPRFLQNNKKSE